MRLEVSCQMRISTIKKSINKIVPLIVIILLWALLSYIIDKAIIVPGPLSTFKKLISLLGEEDFFFVVLGTLRRVLVGFVISLFLATVLGLLSGIFKRVNYFVDPLFQIIRTVPTIAVIMIAIIWLDEKASLLVSFLVVFPVIYTSVVGGVRSVDVKLLAMSDVYNVGFFTKVKGLYFPSIFPYLFVGMRSAISLGIKSTIAAEVISQPMGAIGSNMQQFKINFDIEGVFAWVIVIILISYSIDLILGRIQNRFEDWKEKI